MISRETLRGRALAMALLLAAVALVWFGAAAPYMAALSRSSQQIAAATTQLHMFRRAMHRDNIADADAKQRDAIAALLLPGASEAAAAAWLQSRVDAIASDAGVMLLSFELPPPVTATDAPLEKVTGRIRVTANTGSLRALLHALESHRPLLLLDNLFVRARSDQDIVPGGHLDVQMDVSAWRQATL